MIKFIYPSVILILLLLLSIGSCKYVFLRKELKNSSLKQIDTIIVNKPYPVLTIQTKYIEKPVSVIIYKKDTNLRNQVEKQTIITQVQFVKHSFINRKLNFLQVDKIDTAGFIFSSKYKVRNISELHIDNKGNVKIKRNWHLPILISGSLATTLGAIFVSKKYIFK